MAAKVEGKSVSAKSSSRTNEIVAIVLLAIAVLLFLCLISHNPNDWALNSTGSETVKTQNWIGIFGAVISDLLFQAVGLTAYITPLLFGLIAWRVFYSESFHAPFYRVAGFILFVIASSSLLTVAGYRGGMTGAFWGGFILLPLLGNIGTFILLFAAFSASVLLITNLSYLLVFDGVRENWETYKSFFDKYLTRFKQWRETQNAQAAERKSAKTRRLRQAIPRPSWSLKLRRLPRKNLQSPAEFRRYCKV
jgi:DNA segregation ATPase FtsK/SpoIIIE-like protein